MGKKDSQSLHGKKRCLERCGVRLDEERYQCILKAIHGNKIHGITVSFKAQQSSRVVHYTIKFAHKEELYDVVYDSERDVIVTFVPHNEGQIFYHFVNWFGNTINIKKDYGTILTLLDGELSGNHLDIRKITDDTLHVDDFKATLQLQGDRLVEV
jgi:hypothetical protein